MTRAAVLRTVAAVAIAAAVVAGCGHVVGGAARPASGDLGGNSPNPATTSSTSGAATPPAATPALTSILPDADQWFTILGRQPELSALTVQGSEALGRQDAIGDWSHRDCLGVVDLGLESVFTAAPVTAVINGYPVFQTQVAVIAYADPATSGSLFASMADRWSQCATASVVDSSSTPPFTANIGEVDATPTVVSTTVTMPGSYQQVFQRALGQAGRCLVDVAVPVSAGPGPPTPTDAAVRAVAAMQDKAAAASC